MDRLPQRLGVARDPRVGRLPLRRLRAHHLESLYAEMLASGRCDGKGGLDPKTVLEVHVILHLQVTRGDRLFPAFWLAANTAMRRGELLGLRWGDIDIPGGHLSVNRSLISVGYELHETRGKTANSRRWIDLDDVTMAVLARWRDALAGELSRELLDDDYVFCTVGSSRVDLQACKLEYSIVSPK